MLYNKKAYTNIKIEWKIEKIGKKKGKASNQYFDYLPYPFIFCFFILYSSNSENSSSIYFLKEILLFLGMLLTISLIMLFSIISGLSIN